MPSFLEKLRPDVDLQCYFERPSAIAAISEASADAFTLSGTWRQQFDWAVIEWNRDNVFEHPTFRSLPDGDLSGLTLTYDETRSNCIPLDSDLYPTIDWPSIRIWADDGTGEKVYRVPLKTYATPLEGIYFPSSVQLTLAGSPTIDDYVGVAFLDEHYWYQMGPADTLETAINGLADRINAASPVMRASAFGATILLQYVGLGQSLGNSTTGENGDRIGVYTYACNAAVAATEQWDAVSKVLSSGTSPTTWRIQLGFGGLTDASLGIVPAASIRKMRWTYAAALQPGAFARTEFQVRITNWNVIGPRRFYSLAGPGSRRLEDDCDDIHYNGEWSSSRGNFSGGTIHHTSTPGDTLSCRYTFGQDHLLFLGSRAAENCAQVYISVDDQSQTIDLRIPGEDVLVRKVLGSFHAGDHMVTISHGGSAGDFCYFDFLEMAVPSSTLPANSIETRLALATDWDTDHSLALAPERTARMIDSLGFRGRVNHYAGALWFYELVRCGHQYASLTITFSGIPEANSVTEIYIGRTDHPEAEPTVISHLNLLFDTAETVALALALLINGGYTAVRANAAGNMLTIYSRAMGAEGNLISIDTSASTSGFEIERSGDNLDGGVDGEWRTDLGTVPRLNRAARDWSRSYFKALKQLGIEVTAAFSMELGHGDPGAGIAQRYPSGAPVWLNTPALQTNFSPTSIDFWKQVYCDMAAVQVEAGSIPYLQFGEVQWWYFPDDGSGMPFYDDYTANAFRTQFGRNMEVITNNTADPLSYGDEVGFLPTLVGNFTNQIMAHVLSVYPGSRFEVLYPTDVNSTPLNSKINFPRGDWMEASLACLKTESFTYTFRRDLDLSKASMDAGTELGFSPTKRSHLIGISDSSTAWLKEARLAEASGFESVVLFALDQFCLVGYSLPLSQGQRRSVAFL